MLIEKRIGVIGVGKMGTALISGLLNKEVVGKENLFASDASVQRCDQASKTYGISCFSSNKTLVKNSDIVIIAVEPVHVKTVLEDIESVLTDQLLISIAAAISTDFLKRNLKKKITIIRVMPNNPCLIGKGMTVVASAPEVSDERFKTVVEIFSSIGRVLILDESLFDVVTGLSGSGPAYIYLVMEGLIEGGVKAGLTEESALILAAQTVLGAGEMVLETETHPAKLREMVVTPGGTTMEGLKELDQGDVKGMFIRAVERASQKSRELAKM